MATTRALLFDEAAEQRDRDFFRTHPDVVAECVAAYPSWKRFDREELTASTTEAEPASHVPAVPTQRPELELSRVLGWELFVPDDDTRSDEDLLAAAVELAQRESFRTARMEFHEAHAQRLYAAGGDAKTLRADLEKRLGRYQEECAQGAHQAEDALRLLRRR